MKAVILVGGEGTRLRPLTYNTPKSMVPIMNRPFLEHMIGYLKEHGIDDIILTLCYLPDPIQRYFGDGSKLGVRLSHVVEECPLGTAGAVKNVEECLNETFFVFNGDIFTDIDLTAMMEFHRQRGSKVSIALTPVDNPTIYGVVETDAGGRVQRFIEKPSPDAVTTNMINAGAYIVEPEVLSYIPRGQNFTFEQGLFPLLLERGDPVYGYQSDAYWIDIGTPEKYLKLHHDVLMGKVKKSFHGERLGEGIWVEGGCDIHHRAELEGPIVIGRDSVIGSRARLKGPAVIGRYCTIGTGSFIEGAIVWQNTRLGRGVLLKNCVVAENVVIGDRCQVAEGCVLGGNLIIGPGESLPQGTKLWPQNSA
ncbi:MAG: NDP-sugar synthase [Chloroflexi bacterium]|nr:MAG: NDP-sugar synthase [Chloroflexota bacterium]